MKRLFLAIPFEDCAEFINLSQKLRTKLNFERINWVNQEKPHLTLKFLGNTPSSEIPKIVGKMTEVISKHQTFSLDFNKTGLFGSRYEPRVIWLGMEKNSNELLQLANDVLDGFDEIGFLRDRQNFVPHLTIARVKQLVDKPYFHKVIDEIEQKSYLKSTVTKVVLYESILRHDGVIHLPLRTFNLS